MCDREPEHDQNNLTHTHLTHTHTHLATGLIPCVSHLVYLVYASVRNSGNHLSLDIWQYVDVDASTHTNINIITYTLMHKHANMATYTTDSFDE